MIDRLRWLVLPLAFAALLAPRSGAEEPLGPFVEALRQRRMHDVALDYLDSLAANPRTSPSVKELAAFEKCATLLDDATSRADVEARAAGLERAGQSFREFLAANGQSNLAISAKLQLANVSLEQGRAQAAAAKESSSPDAALAESRKRFEQARAQFDAAGKELDAELQKLPKLIPPEETALQARKQRLGSDVVQARLLRASVDYDLAKTFEALGAEAKKHFKAAAASYAAVAQSYRTRAAGLLARLWEGRCYQEMGDTQHALSCFQELMDMPASPDTQAIKSKATRQALECWTATGVKKYQEAIERGERWQQETGEDAADADALAIRYLTAVAYEAQSKTLPAKDPNRKKLLGSARHYVAQVADRPGEYQRPAKVLLVAVGGAKEKETKEKEKAAKGPTTFAEAQDRLSQLLEKMQEVADNLRAAQEKKDQKAVHSLEQQKTQVTNQLFATARLALKLSNDKTPIDDLNAVRWYLCYLLWDTGQYYDAAVLGEFLARRYPEGAPAQRGAKVALAAYVQLLSDEKLPDKEFEAAKAQAIGDYIFKRWGDQELAEDAAIMLLNYAASQRQYDRALEYLQKISPNSPRRGQAELRAGQTLWSAYLRALQTPADARPPQADLDALRKKAEDTFTQGLARVQPSQPVDAGLASAAFAMAQIAIESAQFDKSIAMLENSHYGPLTLVNANNPATAREGFATETYKMALRAYISIDPPQLKKAEGVMNALDKLVQASGDTHAAENLTAVYVSLGRELQRHMQELRKSGKTKELDTVAKAFEIFLDRVTQREAGSSFASLSWAAETYYTLAGEIDSGGPTSAKGKAYYQKAATAYKRLLDVAGTDPKLKDQPPNLIPIRMRLADCYRREGNFDEATKTILEVLSEKPMLLNAQVQAAEIYQARGPTDPKGYFLAIKGSNPGKNGRNIIWGWNTISQIAMKDLKKFEKTFHEARLNMAESRLLFAPSVADPAQRAKIVEAAKQDLWSTYKQVPELGGAETASRYDKLLKEIQKSMGEEEKGLNEFKQLDARAAAASAEKQP